MNKIISKNQIVSKSRSVFESAKIQADSDLAGDDYPSSPPGPVLLLLLDGWGVASSSEANAITSAKMPYFLNLIKEYPVAVIRTGTKNLNSRYLTIGSGQELAEIDRPTVTLAKVLAAASLKQLKITEVERLAALTSFFNGGEEQAASGEDWRIISGSTGVEEKTIKDISLFNKELAKAIKKGTFDFLVAALPYLDLAAASGEKSTVQAAVTLIDKLLKKIVPLVLERKGVVLVCSAHGNAERIRDLRTDLPDTGMTDNPVPLVIVGEKFKGKVISGGDPVDNDLSLLSPAGTLADIAPTILKIFGLDQPREMSGKSLLE